MRQSMNLTPETLGRLDVSTKTFAAVGFIPEVGSRPKEGQRDHREGGTDG